MANQTDVTILEDGHRNAVVRVTGTLDTGDVSLVPAFTVSSFTNNDPNQSALIGFRVDALQYAVSGDLTVSAYWNAATPQLIAAMADSQALKFKKAGGLQPDNVLAPGFDGSINIVTAGYVAGSFQGFTVVLSLVKLYRV